jgi:uncharacterized phage-associated protein
MFDARAVANFLLDHAEEQRVDLTIMTLLKVMYFAQGWHLVQHGKPLIAQPFEAWKYGPVSRVVYDQFKGVGKKPISTRALSINIANGQFEPTAYTFDANTTAFLASIFNYYVRFHAFALSDLTHEDGGPWDQVWKEAERRAVPGMVISNDKILQWFSENQATWARMKGEHELPS